MLIPAAISLIISALFLNLSLLGQGAFFIPTENQPLQSGKILGASEASQKKNSVERSGDLNQAVTKAIQEVRSLPMPRLYQLPQLDQPMRQFKNGPSGERNVKKDDFDLAAENGVIMDCANNDLFFSKRPDRSWPIASITKLFTAYTFLDYNPGWNSSYEIKPADRREGGRVYLFTGEIVTVKDLFYFSLVGSDNTATAALVQSTGLSEEEFIKKINRKIEGLGFKNTRIVDPVGLQDGNISTAREVALFAKIALADEEISKASLTKKYEFYTKQGKKKTIISTDDLLYNFPNEEVNILGGKTGYINSSGYCLVGQFKNHQGREIVTVVLGADSDSSRFVLTKKLVDLYYSD
ncbi:MAG: serine hydrolase [Patescibacteria group bacterium]|nr:serine hydrolase [Patescibacteria group bacterium]